ncbi:MAG: glutamine--fructose-6-phosphate transaminase (isomerizing) [Spirochaetaceae bacterium]|jgi:glucosamine--fructose-6-phosphate aminotransferase (isomerizing)|nr:glutamine--fructose-6-phosphate transaminase (isomerizing) [Spirochaetaceae bacterium]
MCGIAGYIGYKQAVPILLEALKKLEYRGYDSAGIAVVHNGALHVRKTQGRLSLLEKRLETERLEGEGGGGALQGSTGIGHTRWATHGAPSDRNSHPHCAGKIAVVHNGIIENYRELKGWLEARGAAFQSDTDTEVAAHLINYYYDYYEEVPAAHPDRLAGAVMAAMKRLNGSYALGVVAEDAPDRIVAARKDSPLIVGLGEGEQFLASDVPALLSRTREVYFLEEGEVAALYHNRVALFTGDGEPVTRRSCRIDWDAAAAEKDGYPHFMLKEIHEQPRALADTLGPGLRFVPDTSLSAIGEWDIDVGDVPLERWKDAPRIVIAACGTAWHAALAAKYAFEGFARVPVEADIASEYRYRDPIFDPRDLFIAISQSGETADTLAAARLAKARGASVLAITNTRGSTLAREADFVLHTRAGPEIAVASTKAFTTQLMAVYLAALKLGYARGALQPSDFRRYVAALRDIPEKARRVIRGNGESGGADRINRIKQYADRYFNKTKVFFMGRQCDYATALESALKLKEICYTHSEAFAAGELKHGPIALLDAETLVVTIATQRRLFDKVASNVQEAAARGAANLVITWEGAGERAFEKIATAVFPIPQTEDRLSPLLSVIPGQMFAYYCAVARGNDPDKPRNLAKSVTVE